MDSTDGTEQREIEDERGIFMYDNVLEELTNINESDKEESTNDFSDEVPEYRSRSREEVEIRSSVASGAGDSEVPLETERESASNIAFVHNTVAEKENHEAFDFNEIKQEDYLRIQENTPDQQRKIEDAGDLGDAAEIEKLDESLTAYDLPNALTEAESSKILGMNIKVAETIISDTLVESGTNAEIDARKLNLENHETIISEESEEVEPVLVNDTPCVFESDATKEVIETNIKQKMTTDKKEKEDTAEIDREKTQPTEMENIVSVAVMDDFDIDATTMSLTEEDINTDIQKEKEKVFEMNIRVEEGKTNQVDTEKESELVTFVDQKKSPELGDRREKLEEFASVQGDGICKTSDLLATSDTEPATKFDLINLQTDTVNGVSSNKENETAAELRETLSIPNPAESPVPFVPNGIEEAIEFIDSETSELQKGPLINNEPTATVADLVSDVASNFVGAVSDEGSPAHEEFESATMVPPLQNFKMSAPHLANSSNDNIFGSSLETTKSTERSRLRKPEWMRRSLVRHGSVRRLFNRMRSKRFDHDQRPVTPAPEPEPRPPQRPFRQMIVDFLLLLFES